MSLRGLLYMCMALLGIGGLLVAWQLGLAASDADSLRTEMHETSVDANAFLRAAHARAADEETRKEAAKLVNASPEVHAILHRLADRIAVGRRVEAAGALADLRAALLDPPLSVTETLDGLDRAVRSPDGGEAVALAERLERTLGHGHAGSGELGQRVGAKIGRARTLALAAAAISAFLLVAARLLFWREGTRHQRVARSLDTERLRRMDDGDRARVLNSVNQLTEVFVETRDVDAVLNEAVRAIREILEVENIVLELYGSEDSLLRRHIVEGDIGDVDLGEDLYDDVIGNGRSRLINSLENTPEFERLAAKGWKSLLVTPLFRNRPDGTKEPIGFVAAVCTRRRDFTGHEQMLLHSFALHSSMIIENAQLYELTRHMAVRDGLTNLYNHRRFREVLSELIGEAAKRDFPFGLLMGDIDHFKNFNDTHGHLQGDMVLRTVGEILRTTVRGADTVARYGGEEFVVLLPDTDGDGCRRVGDNLRLGVYQHQFEGEETQPGGALSITFGLAMYPADGQEAEGLIDAADKALYVGKHRGRNKLVVYADLPEEERAADLRASPSMGEPPPSAEGGPGPAEEPADAAAGDGSPSAGGKQAGKGQAGGKKSRKERPAKSGGKRAAGKKRDGKRG